MRAACVPLLPLPTHRGQLDTRAFSAKRKIELLVARFLRVYGSRRKTWNDARCCSGGERLAIGTMYPGGIPGPGLIFEAFELVGVRRCRGVRCSTCATTCTPSPFVVPLSKWVSRSIQLFRPIRGGPVCACALTDRAALGAASLLVRVGRAGGPLWCGPSLGALVFPGP